MSAFMPPEVFCGKTAEEVKVFSVEYSALSSDIYSAISGPDIGVEFVNSLLTHQDSSNNNAVQANGKLNSRKSSGVHWSCSNRKAHGTSLSLYDKNPITGKVSGDPIADSFAYIARKNNALMVVADGVNWGERSKIAARCATDAVINYICKALFVDLHKIYTTKEAFVLMRKAFDVAHESIIQHKGGLTTLNITLVLPIQDSAQYAVCSVNVGDSLTYVFSKRYGINELSIGSHNINEERDMKDVGGAIGPVNGDEPYLTNLTFSITTCEAGDIVFLTTDGISDNFDPVVTKIAVPGQKDSLLKSVDEKAEMLPHERHLFAMKGMERVIHEYELETEIDISAQELCKALTQHVINLTKPKRLVIENPAYYNRQYKKRERLKIEETIRKTMRTLPGKLDHATVVAYEAGLYREEMTPNTSYHSLSTSISQCSISDRSSVSGNNIQHSKSMTFETNI